ncbi:MAG: phosphate ABC transporter substrate-binding protein [Treponema phagedenis]|uniref:phosphate ABC transporter substrate-binding protein n=1 Tax=Treponema phagedenis TaxID=162 RepID=UPI003134185E
MKKILALLAFSFIAVSVCFGFGGQEKKVYTFGGSTTVSPIMYKLIEVVQKEQPNITVSYEAIGSSAGLKSLISGEISLAGSSSEFSAEKLKGMISVPIAIDGLSVVVNAKGSGVTNISLENLAKIYHGDIKNWKEVDGEDLPILVVNRDESSGTYAAFWELVCQPFFGKAPAYLKEAIVAKENGEVVAKVLATPGAIGYAGMSYAEELQKAGGKELSIDGVEPTVKNVIAKKYPLSRYLYLIKKPDTKADSFEQKFIDYVLSPKGQAVVKSTGYIPLAK